MPKPLSLFEFTSVTHPITEPSNTRKAAGYKPKGKLPAGHMNWIATELTKWIDGYLNVLEDEELSWAVEQAFLEEVTFEKSANFGSALAGSVVNALRARLVAYLAPAAVAGHTKVLRLAPLIGGTVGEAGLYVATSEDTKLTVKWVENAELLSSGLWSRKVGGLDSIIVQWSALGGFRIAKHESTDPDTWSDAFTSGNWGTPVAHFDGVSSSIGAITTLVSLFVTSLFVTGNASITGDIEAGTGLHRPERIAMVMDYAGITGETAMSFEIGETGLVASIQQRWYRPRAGRVQTVRIVLSNTVAEDITLKVRKNGSTLLTSVLVAAGQTTAKVVLSSGAAYAEDDYLGMYLDTGGAAVADVDVAGYMQVRE